MKPVCLRWMRIGIGTLVALCAGTALGQSFSGHYPIGVEGLKAGSLPPPGVYLRDYNQFYFSDRMTDSDGDRVAGDLDLSVYANAIRPIWITDWKVLGGNYGMDVLVPILYTDFRMNGSGDSSFGVGDLFVEPITLSWHWKQADLGVGYGFWAPTGNSSLRSPAKPGKGYWGHMLTLGGTWYADEAKTWSVSALGRYEINMEHEDIDIRPGDELSIEGGIGKSLSKSVEVGVVGYLQRQVTGDSGSLASRSHDQVFGVGPELNLYCSKLATFFSFRYHYEFGAEDRPEGNTITVTLTHRF